MVVEKTVVRRRHIPGKPFDVVAGNNVKLKNLQDYEKDMFKMRH